MDPDDAIVILFLQCPVQSPSQEAELLSQCLRHPGAAEGWENSPTQENQIIDNMIIVSY